MLRAPTPRHAAAIVARASAGEDTTRERCCSILSLLLNVRVVIADACPWKNKNDSPRTGTENATYPCSPTPNPLSLLAGVLCFPVAHPRGHLEGDCFQEGKRRRFGSSPRFAEQRSDAIERVDGAVLLTQPTDPGNSERGKGEVDHVRPEGVPELALSVEETNTEFRTRWGDNGEAGPLRLACSNGVKSLPRKPPLPMKFSSILTVAGSKEAEFTCRSFSANRSRALRINFHRRVRPRGTGLSFDKKKGA